MQQLILNVRLLDLDLDYFVSPPIYGLGRAPRPSDGDCSVPDLNTIYHIVREKWKVLSETPIFLMEDHDEIINVISGEIAAGRICPPFHWIHVDAHDDLWGNPDGPIYAGNFLFEVIRRGWLDALAWVYPDGCRQNIGCLNPATGRLEFGRYSVPFLYFESDQYAPRIAPDMVCLCRSPKYTPAKADAIYDCIASLGVVQDC